MVKPNLKTLKKKKLHCGLGRSRGSEGTLVPGLGCICRGLLFRQGRRRGRRHLERASGDTVTPLELSTTHNFLATLGGTLNLPNFGGGTSESRGPARHWESRSRPRQAQTTCGVSLGELTLKSSNVPGTTAQNSRMMPSAVMIRFLVPSPMSRKGLGTGSVKTESLSVPSSLSPAPCEVWEPRSHHLAR